MRLVNGVQYSSIRYSAPEAPTECCYQSREVESEIGEGTEEASGWIFAKLTRYGEGYSQV